MKSSERHTLRGEKGFILVEAMVSLIVVSIGILGIVKLNSVLIQGTGYTKARAEAINIAQDRIEQARNFNLQSGCSDTALTNSTNTVNGVNASYTVSVTYPSPSGTDWKTIQTCVTWDGGTCNATGNRIILRSVLACTGTGTSGQVGSGGSGSSLGGFIKTPTGRAVVGGTYSSGTETANTINIDNINRTDGTKINKTTDRTLLVSTNGSNTVLLSMSKRGCETSAPDFSTVSGKVFVAAKNGSPIAPQEHLYVLSSDASYCSVLPYDLNNWKIPVNSNGNNIKYFYTYYKCYIGAEWWGNIGVIRTDNANTNNRVCTGNPRSTNIGTLFSKHAQLGTSRGYRGYREITIGSGIYETKGIGETDTLNTACSTVGKKIYNYKPINYENHHFVHTVLTGSISDGACSAEMNSSLPGYLAPITGSDAAPSINKSGSTDVSTASFNPGKFYCLSNDDGITCPNLVTPPAQPSTTVTGTITASDDVQVALDNTIADNACVTFGITRTSISGTNRTYTYNCTIDWTGFTAGSWSGPINFVTTKTTGSTTSSFGSICAASSTSTVTPSTETISYTIRDSSVATDASTGTYPNSLYFSDIPNAVTAITVNFQAKASCGLGQVDLRWNGGSADPQNLTWTGISGATGYEVQRCTSNPPPNKLVACTPSTGASGYTSPTTTYAIGSLADQATTCVRVRATTSSAQGVWSPTKCVYRNGTSYTYQ